MKFFKFKKEKFKPSKSSITELVVLFYVAFIVFIASEVLSALGTTSYGYIEKSTLTLGALILAIIPISMAFVLKKNNKKFYIAESVFLLALILVLKYIWNDFYIFLDIPDENILCLLLDYLIIVLIFSPSILLRKKAFYYAVVSFIIAMISVCNYGISVFRGIPLAFSDIYCIKDAVGISGYYLNAFTITLAAVASIVLLVGFFVLFKKEKRQYRITSASNIVALVLLIVGTMGYYSYLVESRALIYYSANMVKTYRYNGYVYSTIESALRFIRVKPEGYSESNIADIREQVDSEAAKKTGTVLASKNTILKNSDKKPNIIFVQLEGFMDPNTIEGVLYSRDPIPNFNKLRNNSISGQVITPSIGGGTARTEFEVMTGIDLEYLTDGEVPHYTVLGHKSLNSVATTLKKQGYAAHAIHNNQGNFYNRNKAYSGLGYDTYTSIEYMDETEKTETNWAKDTILTKYIKQCLDSTEESDIVFTISVEGHSPYPTDADKYNLPIKVVSSNLVESETNQIYYYINKINESDQFIGELIEYIDSIDEDTMVVFYGDHTPALDLLNRGGGNVDRTSTPYAIYSNFELDEDIDNKDIHAYQMSTLMLGLAGVDLGPMEDVHLALADDENYKKYLELIEYDILFGNEYYLEEDEKTSYSDLKMGVKDIVLKSAKIEDDQLVLEGENFTARSKVFIDGKEVSRRFIDKNKIVVNLDEGEAEKFTSIVVKQIGLHKISLSETETLDIEK